VLIHQKKKKDKFSRQATLNEPEEESEEGILSK
jgi:hypothetical protein